MNGIDIGVLLLFTVLVFVSGLRFSSSGKNVKSFFAAGGHLPWWMSGLSLFMSFFSAGTFVVWGSIAYSSGWVAITIQWTMALSGLIIGFFIAPKWQKTRSLTAAQFIAERLGQNTQKIYTYLFLLISMFTTGAFLYPVAKIVQVSTGFPINTSIIFLGIIILVYTAVGGLWAVIVTDVLQFVVLTAAVLIVVPLSLDSVGGIQEFINRAPQDFFASTNSEYTWEFMIAFGFYNLFFIAGNWAYVQRYTSVGSPKDAKKVSWLFSALYVISPVIWMLPPMIYKVLNPDLDGLADEGAYLLMCKEVLPVGMLGLMLGGMVFATSSSVNTTLNISAGVLTNDLYKTLFPESDNKHLVKVGRISTAALGIITIIVALLVPKMGGIVEVVMGLAAVTGGAMFLPPIWALFSKHLTGNTAISITLISLVINGFLKFIMPETLDLKLSRTAEMEAGVGIPIFLLLLQEIISQIRKGSTQAYQDYKQLRDKLQDTQETNENTDSNHRGARVIGTGVGLTGLMIICISIIGKSHYGLVGGMGGVTLLVGLIITMANMEKKKSNK